MTDHEIDRAVDRFAERLFGIGRTGQGYGLLRSLVTTAEETLHAIMAAANAVQRAAKAK